MAKEEDKLVVQSVTMTDRMRTYEIGKQMAALSGVLRSSFKVDSIEVKGNTVTIEGTSAVTGDPVREVYKNTPHMVFYGREAPKVEAPKPKAAAKPAEPGGTKPINVEGKDVPTWQCPVCDYMWPKYAGAQCPECRKEDQAQTQDEKGAIAEVV